MRLWEEQCRGSLMKRLVLEAHNRLAGHFAKGVLP